MGPSGDAPPIHEVVFASLAQALQSQARTASLKLQIKAMRVPRPDSGFLRIPFYRGQSEDGQRSERHPFVPVRQAGKEVQKAVVNVVGLVRGGVSNMASKVKQHQEKMKEGRDERRLKRKDRKLGLPWARKRRRAKGNEGSMFLAWKGSPQAMSKALLEKGKAFEFEMDVRAALECYEEANRVMPGDSNTLALCSKAWSDITYLDDIKREKLTDEQKREVNAKAITYCEQAILADPTHGLPHVACCISMGRMALFSDNKGKVALAKTAREQAVVALQKEPQSDLAHHLMGRWHWEMAQLNSIVRTLIRLMYGTSLASGSFTEALECYRKAAELNPTRLVHKVEVGRSLAKMGMKAEALEELTAAVQLPVEDINAYLQKEDALLLIKDLQRSLPRKRPSDALGVDSGMASGDSTLRQPWHLRLPRELALPRWQLPQLPFPPQNGPAPTAA